MILKKFDNLKGHIIKDIVITDDKREMIFSIDDGNKYKLFHRQDCCEDVYIEDIIGDIEDLIDNPILLAEEIKSHKNPDDIKKENYNSFTWTFYKLSTIKGSVTIRWYGESNGYYSEWVDFIKI